MKKTSSLLAVAVGAAAFLAFASPLGAQAIYSSGHGDIGAAYDDLAKEFEPHWHLHAGAVVDGGPLAADGEFAPGAAAARTSATRNAPSGLSGILGVADGTLIYAAGSSAYQPNLGFGVEELVDTDWLTPITLTLTSWTIPVGTKFALYTTNLAGTSVVDRIFSTYAPGSTDFSNSFTMTPGDHMHFQWGFTDTGTYEFELTWSGTHAVDGVISTTEAFSVQVVPEPSTFAMLGLGGAFGVWALRRRRLS